MNQEGKEVFAFEFTARTVEYREFKSGYRSAAKSPRPPRNGGRVVDTMNCDVVETGMLSAKERAIPAWAARISETRIGAQSFTLGLGLPTGSRQGGAFAYPGPRSAGPRILCKEWRTTFFRRARPRASRHAPIHAGGGRLTYYGRSLVVRKCTDRTITPVVGGQPDLDARLRTRHGAQGLHTSTHSAPGPAFLLRASLARG